MFCLATVHSFAEISLEAITENQTYEMTEFLELKMQVGFGQRDGMIQVNGNCKWCLVENEFCCKHTFAFCILNVLKLSCG